MGLCASPDSSIPKMCWQLLEGEDGGAAPPVDSCPAAWPGLSPADHAVDVDRGKREDSKAHPLRADVSFLGSPHPASSFQGCA